MNTQEVVYILTAVKTYNYPLGDYQFKKINISVSDVNFRLVYRV